MAEKAPGEGRWRFWMLLLGGIFAGLVVLGALNRPSPEEQAAREAAAAERTAQQLQAAEEDARARIDAAFAATAAELFNAYQANEVAAQRAIGEREVLVTGRVASIELDFMDEPVVALATPNQFLPVQLDFDDEDAEAIAALAVGDTVTALCGDISEVIGAPMLDDCELM